MWIDQVTEMLTDAAEIAILPRFRALADGEVAEKSPGEVATVADREAEELISPTCWNTARSLLLG
ncbi:hypothetical protein ACWGH8_04090 [Nonomuraea muscovyensis]|uniref:Fructose-1,6-bisphosphatase/inositol monophosphatase family enzyme n=1 Tax=Nonomuraea muscovyensis TaxID=1124761 RepID=A0A7X0F0A9_9ACTN|nr:hypothetical protein [Nonomuraea muscovyensis]MBB6351107.1 fructose-1,6-bisphosphatase/inositol monophosphatase family enzyme [Nonomuraea muscovyensis]